MAESKKVNIAQIYRSQIHAPKTPDGKVCYIPHVGGTNLTDIDKKMATDAVFMSYKDKKCNSPTNIRRVWITHSHVYVEYYAGYVDNGKTKELIVGRKLSENIPEIANQLLRCKAMSISSRTFSGQGEIANITINSRLLSALTHPWTCNNIEEIYFDWSCLVSDDDRVVFEQNNGVTELFGQTNLTALDILNGFMQGSDSFFRMKQSKIPEKLFLGPNHTEISNTYKRLKTIAFVSKLDDLVPYIKTTTEDNRFLSDNVLPSSAVWILTPQVQELLKKAQCDVWVSTIEKSTVSNLDINNFTIKNQQYEFDRNHLGTKIRTYVNKLSEVVRENKIAEINAKKAAEDPDNIIAESGSIEELFDTIRKENGADGEQMLAVIIGAFCKQYGTNTFKEACANMNKQKFIYYAKLAGLIKQQ